MTDNQASPQSIPGVRGDPAHEDSRHHNNLTKAGDQRETPGTPETTRDEAQDKTPPNPQEASEKGSPATEESDKAALCAPSGGSMDHSPSAKGGGGSQIQDAPPAHRNNTATLETVQAPPAEVRLRKANLKLDTNMSMTFPGANIACETPQTPGVFDLQSPVVIIGEDVFQIIDDCPPPPAPFPHRFVSLQSGNVTDLYDLNMKEILGGGRFGEVHVCTEKATGMQLVAKVLKVQSERDQEMALNEINVMNQLDHRNLIQMFDAVESPNEIFLLLEYVGGGELFVRIIDDSYQLMEVDAMVFVRQICEGIFYMHQMHVLHLDLKPENIVCVSPSSHMVKIIDFGLARRYKAQNKLKVSFGTPEFLSPEVINYDHVSFPTDMWSAGVITYMMVSGLSPFLGDNDAETMNNILAGDPGFEEEPFEQVSEEAKDFISNLLVRDKSGRMSAAQCLKHPWLNDLARKAKLCNRLLKSQIELRKYMMRRRWKKNIFAVAAAHRFLKSGSSACLTTVAE